MWAWHLWMDEIKESGRESFFYVLWFRGRWGAREAVVLSFEDRLERFFHRTLRLAQLLPARFDLPTMLQPTSWSTAFVHAATRSLDRQPRPATSIGNLDRQPRPATSIGMACLVGNKIRVGCVVRLVAGEWCLLVCSATQTK